MLGWYYAQARLQARYGERLDSGDWLTLEAASSVDYYLERARSTSLRRFSGHVTASMGAHAIERVLRADWRGYVGEVAAWAPDAWRPAILWVAYLPDIAVIEHLLAGHSPDWSRDDSVYGLLADIDPQRRSSGLRGTPIHPLVSSYDPATPLAARWLKQWRARWPRGAGHERQSLDELIALVVAHRVVAGRSGAASSRRSREDLARAVARLFRREAATPVAVFCVLLLLALDLERFRGGLVRRLLFAASQPSAAA